MSSALYSSAIQVEEDVVSVRRQAREISALLGFDANDQTRIATAVSEVARYVFLHAGGGIAGIECCRTWRRGGAVFGNDGQVARPFTRRGA